MRVAVVSVTHRRATAVESKKETDRVREGETDRARERVCVSVCVCARARNRKGGTDRQSARERETERERPGTVYREKSGGGVSTRFHCPALAAAVAAAS